MSLTNKLYKSRKIILEMLRDRGYNTENYENYTPESIDILFKTNMKVTKDINPIDIELEESNKLLIKWLTLLTLEDQSFAEAPFKAEVVVYETPEDYLE